MLLDKSHREMYNIVKTSNKLKFSGEEGCFTVIGVFVKDRYLFRKIQLELEGVCEVCRGDDASGSSLGIFDGEPEGRGALLIKSFADGEQVTLPIPYPVGRLSQIVEGFIDEGRYLHFGEGRLAFIGSRRVKLTEVEYALAELLAKRGDFVSREEILEKIWGGEADPGVVNVYVHYLRGKLEAGGERVILSSRQRGYSINPEFLKGGKRYAKAD